MSKPVSSAELRKLVDQRQTIVVLFSGKWCPDCIEFEPVWRFWTDSNETFNSLRVEVPRGGEEWDDWRLDEIPTVILFTGGKELRRAAGNIDMEDLDVMIHDLRG